jgi:hypothetical protein
MKPAEGFATQTPYKYYGFDVRLAQTPIDTRRPRKQSIYLNSFFSYKSFYLARPTGGPPQQQMSRNSDSYINRNQNRNQSSNIKRPLPTNNNNIDHHQYGNNNNNRDRHGPINNGSSNTDRHRSTSTRLSHSRSNKMTTPKRTSRAPPPKYTCTLPKASLDW